jgi:hypothetical protein
MGRVLEMYPDLTRDGLGHNWLRNIEEKPNPECVDICIMWMIKNRDRIYRKTLNTKQTSYGMKNEVERETGKYVANGDFICAAVMCGYHIKTIPNGAPNVFLNMNVPQPPKE